jgi:hypothetical protein
MSGSASREDVSWPTAAFYNAMNEVASGLAEAAEECRREGASASRHGHPIKAVMLAHMAMWFENPSSENWDALIDLSRWLPIPTRLRNLSPLERKVRKIRFIKSLKLPTKLEDSQIELATQQPGRDPEVRAIAVDALELHIQGRTWAQIEKGMFPHRRNVKNPGASLRRVVQRLKRTLEKYGIALTATASR